MAKSSAGDVISTWDPHHPIITEASGTIRFEDFIDGVTVTEQVDDMTGLSNIIIMDSKKTGTTTVKPRASLVNGRGQANHVLWNRDTV